MFCFRVAHPRFDIAYKEMTDKLNEDSYEFIKYRDGRTVLPLRDPDSVEVDEKIQKNKDDLKTLLEENEEAVSEDAIDPGFVDKLLG